MRRPAPADAERDLYAAVPRRYSKPRATPARCGTFGTVVSTHAARLWSESTHRVGLSSAPKPC